MEDISTILKNLSPFCFLTNSERTELLRHIKIEAYSDKQAICRAKDEEHDIAFILMKGSVQVEDKGVSIGSIEAVSYFGEWGVLFNQPRKFDVTAHGYAVCALVPGNELLKFVRESSYFSSAFARTLQNKHNIFHVYDAFIAKIIHFIDTGYLDIEDIIEQYKQLSPILHRKCNKEEIDFDALNFILPRLPNNITEISSFLLMKDIPEFFFKDFLQNKSKTVRAKKRSFFEVLPGKTLLILRDELTDVVDFVTKLCVYYCEAKKIIERIKLPESSNKKYQPDIFGPIIQKGVVQTSDNELEQLPFSKKELVQFGRIFKGDILSKFYQIVFQDGVIHLHMKKASVRYFEVAEELWTSHVKNCFEMFTGTKISKSNKEIHVIFGNMHSVRNILSNWLHKNKESILTWGELNDPEGVVLQNEHDQLYHLTRFWLDEFPEKMEERTIAEGASGIINIQDKTLSGIDINLIDLSKLSSEIDPLIASSNSINFKNKFIINVDYCYGKQAEAYTNNLVLLFGKNIKSISILGKAGGLVGNRGDIIIPTNIIAQLSNKVYPVVNQGVTEKTLKKLGWKKHVYHGNMLTVLGTLMQNRELLQFYRLFWKATGMEMEGSYYLKEIAQNMSNGLLSPETHLNVMYYISDIPFHPHSSLSKRMSTEEGVPAVYAITRAIIKRILES